MAGSLAAKASGTAKSIGLVGNAVELVPELLRRGVPIDIVTDQTSAHDPLSHRRAGIELADWAAYAAKNPAEFTDRAQESMAWHVVAMVGFLDAGAEVFDYGNSIRGEARQGGYGRAFDFPGFVPAHLRPLFYQGRGPFRWAARICWLGYGERDRAGAVFNQLVADGRAPIVIGRDHLDCGSVASPFARPKDGGRIGRHR